MLGGVHGEPQAVLHGVVHVTGGGLPGKLGRVLRRAALGADITDPLPPGPLLRYLQEHGNVSDHEAYRVEYGPGHAAHYAAARGGDDDCPAAWDTSPGDRRGDVLPGIRLRSRGYFSTFSTSSTGNDVLVYPV